MVYRLSLYADTFKKFKSFSDPLSVTGCYTLPLCRSSKMKKLPSAFRVVSLIPHVQDRNKILNVVNYNVIEVTISGFKVVDAYGRKFHVFLYMVYFFGDFLQPLL